MTTHFSTSNTISAPLRSGSSSAAEVPVAPISSYQQSSDVPLRYSTGTFAKGSEELRTFRQSLEGQVKDLSSELATAHQDLHGELDALSSSLSRMRGRKEPESTIGISRAESENDTVDYRGQRSITGELNNSVRRVEDGLRYVDTSISRLQNVSQREREEESGRMRAMEEQLYLLEKQSLEQRDVVQRVLEGMERKLDMVFERLDRCEGNASADRRVIEFTKMNMEDNNRASKIVEDRLVETSSGLSLTQDRLESQIQWGNELERNVSARIEELQRAVGNIRSEISSTQRAVQNTENQLREVKNAPTGDSKLQLSVEMLENELAVLHRRLTNVLRVFGGDSESRTTHSEEEIFLMKTAEK